MNFPIPFNKGKGKTMYISSRQTIKTAYQAMKNYPKIASIIAYGFIPILLLLLSGAAVGGSEYAAMPFLTYLAIPIAIVAFIGILVYAVCRDCRVQNKRPCY